MKVAVLNYTGTVGKTTISAHLLSPRMADAPIFAVETINETAEGLGSVDVEKMAGEKFKALLKKLILLDDAIIDVGASNVEPFLDGLIKFEDSHVDIDYYLVPVTSGSKEQKETISIISTLSELGIPANKIKVVFNRVAEDVTDEFPAIINFAKKAKLCTVNTEAAIFENELFDMLSAKKTNIQTLLDDQTDYKAKARELGKDGDSKTVSLYTDLHVMKSLAKFVNRNLDGVYNALFE